MSERWAHEVQLADLTQSVTSLDTIYGAVELAAHHEFDVTRNATVRLSNPPTLLGTWTLVTPAGQTDYDLTLANGLEIEGPPGNWVSDFDAIMVGAGAPWLMIWSDLVNEPPEDTLVWT